MTTQGRLAFEVPSHPHVDRVPEGRPKSDKVVVDTVRRLPKWLGLVTTHRRLFDAGQGGWIHPSRHSCLLLGRETFASEELPEQSKIISVRLTFDVSRLPFPDLLKELKRDAAREEDGDAPQIVCWPAPLPLYAVAKVEVCSMEHKTRLLAMAAQTSNVSLPVAEVEVVEFDATSSSTKGPVAKVGQSLELPESLNAIQGAMAMAVWAVPRIEPWIEALRQSLNLDATAVENITSELDAHWLRIPWLDRDLPDAADDQEWLWYAALHCMRSSQSGGNSPGELAERIAGAAYPNGESRTAESWLEQTQRIVTAEETITCEGWRQGGAGLAIRLALLRPEPLSFKSWSKSLPGLPPAVWWAAAMLCGWHHGFRSLERNFRGDARLQEFIATRALSACWPSGDPRVLHPSQQTSLDCGREKGSYTLIWRGDPVIRKSWQSRAKWQVADLSDGIIEKAARNLASQLGWPCFARWLNLSETRLPTSGGGRLSVDGDTLVVKGKKSFKLPSAISFDEQFDPDAFRRGLATESGVVTDPPEVHPCQPECEPPGLIYKQEFITQEEERNLVNQIDRSEWSAELRRRVQHYGWRYDYSKRRIDESMRAVDFPDWASELARRLVKEGLTNEMSDQLIVNEYRGEQGISAHIDEPNSFVEHVATISLLETWGMVFRRRDAKEKVEKHLERRSVAVLTGDARYRWTHEIPKRANELLTAANGKRKRVKRGRRISLTFRTTRLHKGA